MALYNRWGSRPHYKTNAKDFIIRHGGLKRIRALSAMELPSTYRTMNRAKGWLLSVQKPDGGFGESCESDLKAGLFLHDVPHRHKQRGGWTLS
ncbi:hypothetical protein AN477_23090 [Alicyclobacillus ferrooxydans]|uniref:Squalene cyclase C-terminal domain-containing protein n=1 Tax=Alicyclobacillus ferrooxydans TaxID=471514 RepID=A0A0P9GH87_9BACL|nr:hypothetical protein AN477_23090 [Alicyclobacillus ferrooxydans]